ncbi:MAG TPA: ribose 5-phosphate isomerase B [Firmicutes bacterium]|nr:ribose 5-phosphate isomerase B [Bacillota bacterium]
MTRIIVGCDHRGLDTRDKIIAWCEKKGIEAVDMGPKDTESVDYTDYAFPVGERVAKSGGEEIGILICGWGNGMAIAANKVKGVRAALCTSRVQAEYARSHNNANVLVVSAEATGWGMIEEIINAFINTGFEGGRHERRMNKIAEYESC